MKELLQSYRVKINFDLKDGNGFTILDYAAISKSPETVKTLLDAGAKVDLQNQEGYTALHYAALNQNTDIILLLINKGADINIKNKYKISPLYSVQDTTKPEYKNNADLFYKQNAQLLIEKLSKLELDESGMAKFTKKVTEENNSPSTTHVICR
ncbi:MAG: ankyrin repeat domain-containing protein [Rickettsiales bacterium]|nr:ankyrin repeat domain-containing protein [Rickettsiales bacterium]